MAFNIAFNMIECYDKNLRAGVFALENYYLFGNLFSKPYTKFAPHSIGVCFAFFYVDVLEYRRTPKAEREGKFPKVHYMYEAKWLGHMANVLGNVLVIVNLLCGYESVKSPYSWAMWQNAVYFGLTRISFAIGIMLIFYSVVVESFRLGLLVTSNGYMRAFGKLSFTCGLLCPLIVTLAYCSQEYALYLTVPGVLYYGIANIMADLIASFFVYITVEYPMKRIVALVVMKKISHDEILRQKYCPKIAFN